MQTSRSGRLRSILVNLGVALLSTVLFLAFCEFVVFRFVLPGSDVPQNAFVNEVVRYAPNQTGVWRVKDDVAAPYSINAQGWNSPLPDYAVDRQAGVKRIAVVGDSFVEALQVPVGATFAERMGQGMSAGGPVETLRFGISGAPLSQYVQMVEREAARFHPDVIIVLLVHNDFDESFVFKQGRYTSSFLKFDVKDGKVLGEIPPQPWRPGFVDTLRRTALARFFLYRWQVRPQMVLDAILGPARAEGDPRYAANIDVQSVLASEPDIRAATAHGLTRLATLAKAAGSSLLIVMDGDRRAIEAGQASSPALALNAIAAETAKAQGIAFLDLQPAFAADWAEHHKTFEFESDNHWNEYGHEVAARAIVERLRQGAQ
jgi:hypothetical protein